MNTKKLKISILIIMCMFIAIPGKIYGGMIDTINDNARERESAENDRIIHEYIILDNEGNLYFDVEKARRSDESNRIIEMGEMFNSFSYDMSHHEENAIQTLRGMPIWGNWCGPGYGSGVPIDLLDEGCMRHDNCYVHGGNNCECNKKLIKYIEDNKSRMTTGQAAMADVIALYFRGENFFKGC